MTHAEPEWLGSFFGGDLSFNDCEVLMVQNIPATDRATETALYGNKWYDYRGIHPMIATYYFAECYKQAYKSFMRVAYDKDYADGIRSVFTVAKISKRDGVTKLKSKESVPDFLKSKQYLSYWRLRQLIDKLGMPYEFFMAEINNWYVEQCWRQQLILPPKPGHIMANEDAVAEVMLAWEDVKSARIQFAKDPELRVQNFVGSVAQLDYERFIVKQINSKEHKRFSLCAALYKHDAIRVETAVREFGADLIEQAVKEATYLAT